MTPQDARFTYLHSTSLHLLSLSIDDDPEVGWGVMPGFDQNVAIPSHHEPPRMDADETLPSMMHPSYPYGRGPTVTKVLRGGGLQGAGGGAGLNIGGDRSGGRGGEGNEHDGGEGSGAGLGPSGNKDLARLFGGQGQVGGRERDRWIEFGLDGILERERKREAPPVMAVRFILTRRPNTSQHDPQQRRSIDGPRLTA